MSGRVEAMELARFTVETLGYWSGPVHPEPLGGGLTNRNFVVTDRGQRFVARVGNDIPVHLIVREHERAAARAAHAAGIGPEVVYTEPGALVMRYIEGRPLAPEDVRDPARLGDILGLVRRCHTEVGAQFVGPALAFWPFHVVRNYIRTIQDAGGYWAQEAGGMLGLIQRLERGLGQVSIVFGHNDLLAANFIDDGQRLWLIDYDYAGYNSPLFDLANLASNSGFDEEAERRMLALYLGEPPGDAAWRSYSAMRATSLLRETLWSMVSELHSSLDFDYRSYTLDYRQRLADAVARFDWLESRS